MFGGNRTPGYSGASTDCNPPLPGNGDCGIAGIGGEAEHRVMAHEERARRARAQREDFLELGVIVPVHEIGRRERRNTHQEESNTRNCVSALRPSGTAYGAL